MGHNDTRRWRIGLTVFTASGVYSIGVKRICIIGDVSLMNYLLVKYYIRVGRSAVKALAMFRRIDFDEHNCCVLV